MPLATKLAALCGLILLTSAEPSSAEGPNGPWCAVFNLGLGAIQEKCGLPTFETCRREAQIYGPTAFCRQNNWYAPYWGVGEPRGRARVRQRRLRAH